MNAGPKMGENPGSGTTWRDEDINQECVRVGSTHPLVIKEPGITGSSYFRSGPRVIFRLCSEVKYHRLYYSRPDNVQLTKT